MADRGPLLLAPALTCGGRAADNRDIGEDDDTYGRWGENDEFNPFDGDPDDEALIASGLRCVNCDGHLSKLRYPYLYCSQLCRQEAKAIRYARAVTRDGRIKQPDVAEAVKIKLGFVLGGGYSEEERRLPEQLRATIFERDGYRCRVCGGQATQIDHINEDAELVARDINDPANLQAICGRCHRDKTLSTFKPVTPEHQAKADALEARIEAPEPLRECDDELNWKTTRSQRAAERSTLVKALHS